MKLNLNDLDGLKLAQEDTFAPVEAVRDALEHAYQQASQGWGVKREIAVYLSLARDLKIAMHLAETADEAQRMLKGAQMALGREKKAREKAEAEVMALELRLKAAEAEIEKSQNGD